MATFSTASPNRKQTNRNRFSSVSVSPKSWNNTVGSFNNNTRLVETNLVSDFNKNVTETSKTTRSSPKSSNKIEKTTLKQSLPKLLCLKKHTNSSNENTFKTLNVNTLGTENLSWNDYYNVNGNASKSLDSFHPNRNGVRCYDESNDASPSSSKHIECLSNPNKNRKSFHQNVEDALSSLLWQPYEYQTKTSATSMTSRFVFILLVLFVYTFFLYCCK